MGFTRQTSLWAEGITERVLGRWTDKVGRPLLIIAALTFLTHIAIAWIGGRI
jgi:hypothetical protein